jgi:hypothetical protein
MMHLLNAMEVSMEMFLFHAGYRGGIIGHTTRKLLFLSFVLALVPGKVIGDSSKREL